MAQEIFGILKGIPIEEINREKRRFCIKALHDHGYHSIADIATASVYTILSIHGISEDNKTPFATQVVFSIAKLRKSEPHIIEYGKLYRDNKASG